MIKKMKRSIAALAITLMAVSAPMSVFASGGSSEPEMVLGRVVTTPENGERAAFSATVSITGNSTRCYGAISSNMSAHTIQAKCEVNNNGQSVTSSGYTIQNNTTAASSAYVYASTKKCKYTATGKARKTISSTWHSGSIDKSYS